MSTPSPSGLNNFMVFTMDGGTGFPNHLHPDDERFLSVSMAVNIGFKMAEAPAGRRVLAELGCELLQATTPTRATEHLLTRVSDIRVDIHQYVNFFLSKVRANCPMVIVGGSGMDSHLVLASHTKADGWWQRSHQDFDGKNAGHFCLQPMRVKDMAAAHDTWLRSEPGGRVSTQASTRWKKFLFQYSCAILHELCHLFVGYLLGGARPNTPPKIDHLSYGRQQRIYLDEEGIGESGESGESGRWVENKLFGGALEHYHNPREDDQQAGIAYILAANDKAYKVQSATILAFINDPQTFTFPFPVERPGITLAERNQRGMELLCNVLNSRSSTRAPVPAPPFGTRQLRSIAALPTYWVNGRDLEKRVMQPGIPVRTVRLEAMA